MGGVGEGASGFVLRSEPLGASCVYGLSRSPRTQVNACLRFLRG